MMTGSAVAALITTGIRLLTGVQPRWLGCGPANSQRVYFANHASHVDFVLIWSALPTHLRRITRPVAASDYWNQGAIRRFLIHEVFRGVLVDREHVDREHNPVATMRQAIREGTSLILFPEGTRGNGKELLPFRAGLYHLAHACSELELVPVWIDNSYRVMPKGATLPVPWLCSVAFGTPMRLEEGEHKTDFLDRLRGALIDLGKQ